MPIPVHLRSYLIKWPLDEAVIVPPEETFKRIDPLRETAGITRCADITSLDCVGIPTYMAIRPLVDHYDENISVYNGKGITPIQAKVSALMEAFERHAAERHQRGTLLESFEGIVRYGEAVNPHDLVLPTGESYDPKELLEWVCGTNLLTGGTCYLPAMAAFFPYRPKNGARFFRHFSDTNGLASGNSIAEAISHALAEVIERDAEAVAESKRSGHFIDLTTIPSPLVQELLEKFHAANIDVFIREVTSKLGIPTFVVAIDDPVTEDPLLLCRGLGTHVNAEIALIRAITEAAQSRCAFISGSREDMVLDEPKRSRDYHELKAQMSYWYQPDLSFKDFREIQLDVCHKVTEDIDVMLATLKKNHFNRVIAIDLSHPQINIPVTRVIVPGLEQIVDSKRRRLSP